MDFFARKTVAVTGSSGYLGSALVNRLSKLEAEIIQVSRRDLPVSERRRLLRTDSYLSKDLWVEIFSKADVIFHLAGSTSAYQADKDPVESVNSSLLPVAYMLDAARTCGCLRKVVFASTATVYGLTDIFPVTESCTTEPLTNYDLHKLFVERQLKLATNQGLVEAVSLRLANVYGPSLRQTSFACRGVLNQVLHLALSGVDISVFGGGRSLRDYIYVDDVVDAFIAAGAVQDVVGKSLNVASGCGVTVRSAFQLVVDRVCNATGKQVYMLDAPWPEGASPIEMRNFVGSSDELQRLTGWRPTISLTEGVDRMISYFSRKLIL